MRLIRRLAFVFGAAVLSAAAHGKEAPETGKPDLVVSDLARDGEDLVLEVQNQGPGKGRKGTTVEATLTGTLRKGRNRPADIPVDLRLRVPVPTGVGATESVRVPLSSLGTGVEKENGVLFSVVLDPAKTLAEHRPDNNSYYRQVDFTGRITPQPRGDYKDVEELPDLAITDITLDNDGFVAHFVNKGRGVTGADFLIAFKSRYGKFDGNYFYRFRVPAAGGEAATGRLDSGLIGLPPPKPVKEFEVEVTIDPENRVRESDKKNNTFKKKFAIP